MNELLNDDILILDSTEGLSFIGQGNTGIPCTRFFYELYFHVTAQNKKQEGYKYG